MAHMNPRNHSLLIVCLAAVLCCYTQTVCSQTNFCSNGINFHLFNENTKGIIAPGYNFTNQVNGFTIQAAYNPWKKLIVTGNFFGAAQKSGIESYEYKYNRQVEFGLGAYENAEKLHMSALIGGGLGRIACQLIDRLDYDTKFSRVFLQSSLTYANNSFYVGTALRLNYLNFYKANVSLNYIYSREARLLESSNPSLQPEIGIIIGTKNSNVFLDFEFTFFQRPVEEIGFSRTMFRFSFGCFLKNEKPNNAKTKKKGKKNLK